MGTMEREGDGISRRNLLGAGLGVLSLAAAGAALAPAPTRAQPKMAAKLVQYQDTPKNNQKCSDCLHFIAPDQCKVVEGKVKPNGWCALYAPKPK
jgi:hypothetical protein